MKRKKTLVAISDDAIVNRIFTIRDKRVMIDSDLGELYGVSTKRLNEQVKRNAKRFPADFMLKLNRQEKQHLIRTVPRLNPDNYQNNQSQRSDR
ncbi:MAG TPA: ORF6N domain-containing protein [Chryseolinea sp.]|nr:ORF6N domain-containing protein [Chryseolinea sp.]